MAVTWARSSSRSARPTRPVSSCRLARSPRLPRMVRTARARVLQTRPRQARARRARARRAPATVRVSPPPAREQAPGPFGTNGFDLSVPGQPQCSVLLTITTTRAPATDLGYLLHKHPDRLQSFAVAAGQAHVFYPEAAPERCSAALLLEVDPIGLVRGHKGQDKDIAIGQYVNDLPYAASSLLA